MGILTYNLLQTFLGLLMQLRLFQIVQAEEDIEPPADSKQKPFIRWQGQKAVNRREHFLFLRSQISSDLQKQIDDVVRVVIQNFPKTIVVQFVFEVIG